MHINHNPIMGCCYQPFDSVFMKSALTDSCAVPVMNMLSSEMTSIQLDMRHNFVNSRQCSQKVTTLNSEWQFKVIVQVLAEGFLTISCCYCLFCHSDPTAEAQ